MDICQLLFDVEAFIQGATPGTLLETMLHILFIPARILLGCPTVCWT